MELRKQTEEKLNFVREDLRKILIDMIKAKSEETSFDNTLCEIVHTKQGPQRLPSKLDAAQQLAKICGYNEPDKPQEHNHLHLTVDSVNATSRFLGSREPSCQSSRLVKPPVGWSAM